MGSAQKTESPTLPDRVASEIPLAPVVPSPEHSVSGQQGVEGWAKEGGSEDARPWEDYPTMREQAGKIDKRPEHLKDVERKELYKQDQAREQARAQQEARGEQTLLDTRAAANARTRANAARVRAREAASYLAQDRKAYREPVVAETVQDRQLGQLESNVRQIQEQVALAQHRLSGLERRIAAGEGSSGPESLENAREAERDSIRRLENKLRDAKSSLDRLQQAG